MSFLDELASFCGKLGTPLIDEQVLKNVANVVVLRKVSEQWAVSYFNGVLVEDFVFDSLGKAREYFNFLPFEFSLENVVIFSKEPISDQIAQIYEISERFFHLSNVEERLSKFSYQISGIGTILSSLTEPLPMEFLLPLFAESISELFLTPVGVYRTTSDGSTLIYFVGERIFEHRRNSLNFKGVIFGKFEPDNLHGFEFRTAEGNVFHLVLGKETFEPEEISILNALGLVFQKGRELLQVSELSEKSGKLVNLYEFVLRALSEFSVHVLSSRNFSELEKNVADYIAELYQSKFTAIYKGKDLLSLAASKKIANVELPITISRNEFPSFPVPVIEQYSLRVFDQEILILVGEELVPGYLDESVKKIMKEIIGTELLRAVENVIYQQQLEKEKATLEFYNTVLAFVLENYLNFQEMEPEETLKLFRNFSESFLPFTVVGARLYDFYKFGLTSEIEGRKCVEVKNFDRYYGAVFCEFKRQLTKEEEQLLFLISIILLTSIEYALVNKEDKFDLDTLITLGKFKYFRRFSEIPVLIKGLHEDARVTVRFGEEIYSLLPEYFLS